VRQGIDAAWLGIQRLLDFTSCVIYFPQYDEMMLAISQGIPFL
jgi:hypothetical protein